MCVQIDLQNLYQRTSKLLWDVYKLSLEAYHKPFFYKLNLSFQSSVKNINKQLWGAWVPIYVHMLTLEAHKLSIFNLY